MVLRVDEREHWSSAYFSCVLFFLLVLITYPQIVVCTAKRQNLHFPSEYWYLFSLCVSSCFFKTARDIEDRFDSCSDESSMWYKVCNTRWRAMVRTPHRHLCSAAERLPSRLQVQAQSVSPLFLTGPMGNLLSMAMGP